MFIFHIAYALELIALGIGVSLLSWALQEKGKAMNAAKIFGYIITILSIILFLCSLWTNISIWRMHRQLERNIQLQQNMRPVILQQLMQQRLQQQQTPTKPMNLHKPQTNVAPTHSTHKTATQKHVAPHKSATSATHKPAAATQKQKQATDNSASSSTNSNQ